MLRAAGVKTSQYIKDWNGWGAQQVICRRGAGLGGVPEVLELTIGLY